MPDYSKAQIYKVWDNGYNQCYIGSTINSLSKRMEGHRAEYTKYKNGKCNCVSVFSLFDEYGVENCKIEWVEDYPCNSKKELEAREGKHQKENDCINKRIAGRTDKQYYDDNRDEILKQKKEYYNEHVEEIKHRNKNYYETNRAQVLEQREKYRQEHQEELKEYFKQRYDKKKEDICEKAKQYRKNNLEHVREIERKNYYETKRVKRMTKYTCECGETLSHASKWGHQKTMKHQQYLKSLEETN